MLDLHRHDEFSSFDGFGKASSLAKIAKDKGFTALGLTNHGNTNGLVEHYFACYENGIKPVMGCEVYFQPKFDPQAQSYHLCLIIKDLTGFENLNRILTEANANHFYRKPIVTFALLAKYSEGIICTSACVGGFISMMLHKGKHSMAQKALDKFEKIFGDDFYVELQPYSISSPGMQESVNLSLLELAKQNGSKIILTSDSHYGREEDFATYLKMHQIGGRNIDYIKGTYSERYMPDHDDLFDRFVEMHGEDLGVSEAKRIAKKAYRYLEEIEAKVQDGILESTSSEIPKFDETKDSKALLKDEIFKGLKARGKKSKKYLARAKEEFDVICLHGYEDYFLIVQDYVRWAKSQDIAVGPGRGSVCNCLIAYALGITEVDSIYFDLDYRRFLRADKKKLPDIDLDFETDRRQEVIQYIVQRYPGRAAQICSYGLYKVDNLINDLCKVCDVESAADKKMIKEFIKQFENDGVLDYDRMLRTREFKIYNKEFDNILVHFSKLFKQVRFIGTHAAGVVIAAHDINEYTAVAKRGDLFTSCYDLNNLEKINGIKFDILGLKTMSETKEMENLTGYTLADSWFEDEAIFERFAKGDVTGIFQYESPTARSVLTDIHADTMEDVIAASALNRPGPLSLKMPAQYAHNKANADDIKSEIWWEYTKETYGTVVYQEQIMSICVHIAGMSWSDADRVIKHQKSVHTTDAILAKREQDDKELRGKFIKGCVSKGMSKEEANQLFEDITVYSFNKGHAAGYAIISVQQMFYKVYYPQIYWYVKMKYCKEDKNLAKFKSEAIREGNVIFLPHVNYSAQFSLMKFDGDKVIVEGLSSIKDVGEKCAKAIEDERKKNGKYTSIQDLTSRIPKKVLNSKALAALKNAGALEFDKKIYMSRVIKYNSSLYARTI